MPDDGHHNGRDRLGRFATGSAPAGPGRKRGPCKRTRLRDAMLASMERHPKGFKGFLDELRDSQPIEFLKVYARLQPREHRLETESRHLVMNVVEMTAPPLTLDAPDSQASITRPAWPQLPQPGDE